MDYEYDEPREGGERWIITNDAKTDDPTNLFIVCVEERNKKDGKGSFPALILEDDKKQRFITSAYPRTVERIVKEYGTKTKNWKGMGVLLQKRKNSTGRIEIDLLPWNPALKVENIA